MSALPHKPHWRVTEAELASILANGPEMVSLIDPLKVTDEAYASEVAEVKRFAERWRADRTFRERLPGDPAAVCAEFRIKVDPQVLRSQWDSCALPISTDAEPLPLRRHRFFIREKLLHREKLRSVACVPHDLRFRKWRERQVSRTMGHLGLRSYDGIVHAPVAIELSDGCSIGCWFCGVSAKRKTGDFRYTPDNATLWREVLSVLKTTIGPAAAHGFLYWATEPLDNPDYEHFATDFADLLGKFPQTTTSIAHRDVERTRRLLALSKEKGCTINRFSVLSLAQFNRIMEAFTATELLHCEIVPQNPESLQTQSQTGRARGNSRLPASDAEESAGTIACISGFLINMVRRSVRLITPCPASARWPEGYWILEEANFETASELASVLESMIASSMPVSLKSASPARWRRGVHHESIESGFRLASRGITSTFELRDFAVPMRDLGELVASGRFTAGEIALDLEERFDCRPELVFHVLNQLFDAGQLDEEPAAIQENQTLAGFSSLLITHV